MVFNRGRKKKTGSSKLLEINFDKLVSGGNAVGTGEIRSDFGV